MAPRACVSTVDLRSERDLEHPLHNMCDYIGIGRLVIFDQRGFPLHIEHLIDSTRSDQPEPRVSRAEPFTLTVAVSCR